MKNKAKMLVFLCCFVYFASYVTRINFATVIAEIVSAEGFLKSDLSIVVLVNSLSYGIGQILTGKMGDRFNPVNIIFAGLLTTIVCNSFIPVCQGIGLMTVVWMVNGFAQAMMWPPMVRILSTYLNDEEYSKATSDVSVSASLGRIAVYLFAPFIINVFEWRGVFLVSAAVGIITAVMWKICMPKIEKSLVPIVQAEKKEQKTETRYSIAKVFIGFGLVFVCLAIGFQGYIRDGIDTWLPSIISEVFKTEASSAILLSVVLPLISVFGLKVFAFMQRKWFKNELHFAAGLFLCCMALSIVWIFTYNKNVILAVMIPALISAIIHGVNFMLTCLVPRRFMFTGRISQISGMLNFSTYIGSAVASYGTAKLAETLGWNFAIPVWSIAAILGVLSCVTASGIITKKLK